MRRSRSRPSPALRATVRAGAAACVAAAVVVPLLRRRLRIPAPRDGRGLRRRAAGAGGAAAALASGRDVALFAMQMWAFTVVHELPYDDPRRCGRGCGSATRSGSTALLGRGRLPNARLQRGAGARPGVGALDRVLSWVHWAWFIEPHLALLLILARHRDRFARAARQMAAVFDLGCAVYFLVPTAPPWWAAGAGRDRRASEVRRIMVEVGEETWGAGLGADVRRPRRQPVGGDAVASLRHLAAGGDAALRGRARRGRAGLGLRAQPRLRPRLPGRALRHRPDRRRRPGRPGPPRGAARRAGGRSRSTRSCGAWSGSRPVSPAGRTGSMAARRRSWPRWTSPLWRSRSPTPARRRPRRAEVAATSCRSSPVAASSRRWSSSPC